MTNETRWQWHIDGPRWGVCDTLEEAQAELARHLGFPLDELVEVLGNDGYYYYETEEEAEEDDGAYAWSVTRVGED